MFDKMQLLFTACFLSAKVGAFRVSSVGFEEADDDNCDCSTSGIVNGEDTHRVGCGIHFGQRFGYVCYVNGGASCTTARESHSHPGLYWRSCAAEHHIEVSRGYLLQSMEGIDVEDIQTNIRIAEQRGVDQATLDAAAQRIETIHQMEVARDELTQAVRHLDYDRLRAALETAEELELDAFLSEETLEEAVERLNFLSRRRDAHNNLASSMAAFSLDDLLAKLEEARSYQVDPLHLQRGEERVAELRRMIAEAASELAASIQTRSVDRLTNALLEAERLNAVEAPVMQQGQDRLQHLVQMEQATQALLQGIQGDNLHQLEAQLATATDLDADPEVLSQGRQRVQQLTAMRDSVVSLEAAIAGRVSQQLSEALAECRRLGALNSDLESRAAARKVALEEMDAAAAELRGLLNSDDAQAVVRAVQRAREADVDPELIEQGEHTRHWISQRRHEVHGTMVWLTYNSRPSHREEMRGVIDEARRLHAASDSELAAAELRYATLR